MLCLLALLIYVGQHILKDQRFRDSDTQALQSCYRNQLQTVIGRSINSPHISLLHILTDYLYLL